MSQRAWDYFKKTLEQSIPMTREQMTALQNAPVATDEQLAALDGQSDCKAHVDYLRGLLQEMEQEQG